MNRIVAVFLIVCIFFFSACAYGNNFERKKEDSTQGQTVSVDSAKTKFDKRDLVPLYSLPENDLHLFGLGEFDKIGMVLYHEETETYFPWKNRYPYQQARMDYADYDDDEKNEIAIVIGAGTGTGLFREDLHILTVSEVYHLSGKAEPLGENDFFGAYSYADHALLGHSVEEWITATPKLTSSVQGGVSTIRLDGKSYPIHFPVYGEFVVTQVLLGDIVEFCFDEDDNITVGIGIYAKYEQGEQHMHEYCGTMRADVLFDGKGFAFDAFSFEADEDCRVAE